MCFLATHSNLQQKKVVGLFRTISSNIVGKLAIQQTILSDIKKQMNMNSNANLLDGFRENAV